MKVMDLFSLKDEVAIVTGGHAWLGYDMACALAEAGCSIIITSRELSRAGEAAAKIAREYAVDSLGLEMDQRSHEQVKQMAEKAYNWKGHVDILINNAGGGSGKSEGNLFKRSPQDIADLIGTNLVVGRDREMYRKTNKMEQPIDYAASKAGVIGMTRDLAGLLSPRGINVNCISPGGFNKGEPEEFVKAYSSEAMLGRMGRMGVDIKGAALFLASHASDYITGHNLVVDGGFSVWK